jgi:hypothetical protein
MRFGLITPVFDGCVESLELLHGDLTLQTHLDWIWMLCSNGHSDRFAKIARAFNEADSDLFLGFTDHRERVIYAHVEHEEEMTPFNVLANISKRRQFCIGRIDCDYIFLMDADAKILNPRMFEIIDSRLEKDRKGICVYNTIEELGTLRIFRKLPVFPIEYNRIDALNYCVEASLAKKVGYPADVEPAVLGNDYRFFERLCRATGGDFLYIDEIFCQHNGNNRYENLMTLMGPAAHPRLTKLLDFLLDRLLKLRTHRL